MKYYTVVVRLTGALADAVALEWTSHAAPLDSGQGWEPCLRRADGTWRFSSRAAPGAEPPHRRGPGAFGDIAIRYRLSAAGAWSAPSPSRKEIVIVEVIDDDDVLIPPTLLRAPALTGAALIGAELAVDPGLWSGFPAPALGFQWRRAGTDIPGAVGRAYAPVPADDRRELTCAVTARNLAGETAAVSVALRTSYPIPVALGDLPEEVFDEGVGPELVDASTAFAGADLSFAAVGAPIDRRTGVVAVPTHAPVSGATVTITATNSGGSATARLAYTVEAAPEEPAESALPAPTGPMLAESMDMSMLEYNFGKHGNGSGGVNRPKTTHTTMVCALGALAGVATTYGGRTPREYLLDQINYWTAGAYTAAGNRMPSGRAGVYGSTDLGFVCAVAVAKMIPNVWDALTPAQRTKLDLCMKGLMVACCFQQSDTNPYVTGGGDERRIDGGPYGRGYNFNFTHPGNTIPLIVSAYMGGATLGAAATAFLNSFNRASFAAELAAAGLYDMRQVFNSTLLVDGRAGPTAAQLQDAIRDFRYLGRRLISLSDVSAIIIDEINEMWAKTIKQGLTLSAGSNVPNNYPAPTPGQFGIFEPASNFGGVTGRGAFVGRITNLSDWSHWQEEGLAGQVGMAWELDSNDGGGGSGSGSGPRSAMTYAHDGARICLMTTLTLIAQGQLARSSGALQTAFARQGRGVRDLELRSIHGYRSFAKGGRPWAGNSTNEDWTENGSNAAGYRLTSLRGLWLSIAKPWYEG